MTYKSQVGISLCVHNLLLRLSLSIIDLKLKPSVVDKNFLNSLLLTLLKVLKVSESMMLNPQLCFGTLPAA